MVCEEICDATADQSGVLAQAWALPAESRLDYFPAQNSTGFG